MGFLSVRASKTFVEVFRSIHYAEQNDLAAVAHNKGNRYDEFVYRRNMVDSSTLGNLTVFNSMKTTWTFSFPFAAPVLDRISDPQNLEKGRKLIFATDLALLAEATENIGLKEEADKLWRESARLMGHNDINIVRSLVSSYHKIKADTNAQLHSK